MIWARIGGLTAAAAALVVAVTSAVTSCSQTPVNIPVRTFQQAKNMDIVCIQVADIYGNPLLGSKLRPVPVGNCSPVPVGGDGTTMEYHLYSLVTQTTPGTLAVVDLTGGTIIDEDHATPGVNFIPVGPQPTDVAVSPDGAMTFVTSADIDKPAIYAIDNRRVLGDSTGNPTNRPLTLPELPSCSLPQPPDAVKIVQPVPGGPYQLLVMLRSVGLCGTDAGTGGCAKIAVIDPEPLLAEVGLSDAGALGAPGTLPPCRVVGASGLTGALPPSWQPGPAWDNGVPYLDGGVDLTDAEPALQTCSAPTPPPGADGGVRIAFPTVPTPYPVAMTLRTDVTPPLLYVSDGALPLIHVLDVSDPANPREEAPLVALTVRNPSKLISVGPLALNATPTRSGKVFLYAVDLTEGDLMVFDITDPASTQRTPLQRPNAELNPNLPVDRISFSSPVATVALASHDWLLESPVDDNLYYSGLLCNPNPNAHPNATTFKALGAYYRVDQAGLIQNSATVENFPTRLRGTFAFATLTTGEIMPIDVEDWDAPCRRPDPMAPAPGVYGATTTFQGQAGALDFPEPPATGPDDLDEYHVPTAYNPAISESAAVTLEAYFPVSAPHRLRSSVLLQDDPNSGPHIPGLVNAPRLFDQNGSPVQTGSGVPGTPLILPTQLAPGFIDPSQEVNPAEPAPSERTATNAALATPLYSPSTTSGPDPIAVTAATTPGVRLSFDDPTASIEQNWAVTYEGVLPGTPAAPADLVPSANYQTITLTTGVSVSPGGPANGLTIPGYCQLGIEDAAIGKARRNAQGIEDPSDASWTADYVELADDLLASTDPYWASPNSCWEGTGLESGANVATDRYNACADRFGAAATDAGTSGNGTLADNYLTRDFPILEAYADHLVIGRFGWNPTEVEQTSNRVIVGADQSNEPFLKYAQCCFHNQSTFKVRAGGEWLVTGGVVNLIHHVVNSGIATGDRCVLSCSQVNVLKNGRLLDLPLSVLGLGQAPPMTGDAGADGGLDAGSTGSLVPTDGGTCLSLTSLPAVGRNDPRAMRNPMMSFIMVPPTCGKASVSDAHTLLSRDLQWRFQEHGVFSPLQISISQGSTGGVSPQSMFFIAPFGQMAVVDAEQQGLVLIDLNTLSLAHAPYF